MRLQIARRAALAAGSTVLLLVASCRQADPAHDVFMGYLEGTQVNVTTRIPGRITGVFVTEGQYVRAGQRIAQLDDTSMVDNLRALRRELANIATNRQRLERLYAAGAIPEQKLDEIQTTYDVVTDRVMALASDLRDLTITSPIAGKIAVRVHEPGEMLAPGMPVAVVQDTATAWARFSIPESFADRVRLGQVFTLSTGTDTAAWRAEVVEVLPMADFATKVPTNLQDQRDVRAFAVRMKLLDHRRRMEPGMYVYLTLPPAPLPGGSLAERP